MVGQCQIRLALPHLRDALLRVGLEHVELDLGVGGGKPLQGGRKQPLAAAGEGRHGQAVDAAAGELADALLRAQQLGDDHVGGLDEHPARLGELRAAGAALDNGGAEGALERGDLLRDGARGEQERGGRLAEAAVLGHLSEHAEPLDVDH
jgi:hypothetical protein